MAGLVVRADAVLVGGAIALPILQAIGQQPAHTAPEGFLSECRGIHGLAARVSHRLYLPEDLVWQGDTGQVEVKRCDVPGVGQVVDIGPLTRLRFAEMLQGARTILWTGALGQVETRQFAEGTVAVAAALRASQAGTVIGGDALVSVLEAEGLLEGHIHALSATNSALELLKNGTLPALAALASPR